MELLAGENPEFTHHVQHMAKLECTIAPCFKYQIKSSESGISEGRKCKHFPTITADSPQLRFLFVFMVLLFLTMKTEFVFFFSGRVRAKIKFSVNGIGWI